MKYKAVIFDCDGVLVDSEPISDQVIVELANDLGANIDLEYAHRNFTGGFLSDSIKKIEGLIDRKVPDNFVSEYRRISFARFEKEIQPIEGVIELLDSLQVPFCVASNGPLNKMKLNLKTTGLIEYFKGNLYSAYELNSWKPDPTLFLYAAKQLGIQPKDCVVIEDSSSGVKAGVSGGFDVLAYGTQKNQKELDIAGAKVFLSMKEIRNYLLKH